MTIHQLPQPCWAIDPASLDGSDGHYDSRTGTLAGIRQAWDYDQDWAFPGRIGAWWREFRFRLTRLQPGAPRPRQLAARCWAVQCDGECEVVLDTEDEGWVFHHRSRADAERTMAAYEWAYVGDLVFCAEDAPEDGQIPPPSPAEQEKAGQLSLLAECQDPR